MGYSPILVDSKESIADSIENYGEIVTLAISLKSDRSIRTSRLAQQFADDTNHEPVEEGTKGAHLDHGIDKIDAIPLGNEQSFGDYYAQNGGHEPRSKAADEGNDDDCKCVEHQRTTVFKEEGGLQSYKRCEPNEDQPTDIGNPSW